MIRCHCKPMCLAPIVPGDAIVTTVDGWPALAEHVGDVYPQEPLPLTLDIEVAS